VFGHSHGSVCGIGRAHGKIYRQQNLPYEHGGVVLSQPASGPSRKSLLQSPGRFPATEETIAPRFPKQQIGRELTDSELLIM
jgi:hypothetical protein